MSGIVGSKLNIRGSGRIAKLGTDGQVLTSAGAGLQANYEDAAGGGLDWQSVVTASTFTAVAGNGYPVNTTSNACTVTLPASASVGDEITFTDYARNFATNALTINPNSLKYQGNTTPQPVYDTAGESIHIVYMDTTKGWIPTYDGAVVLETPQWSGTAYYLVVAGGAGGGGEDRGGGGGAGGYRTNHGGSAYTLGTGITYTITVGTGGAATSDDQAGNEGVDSSFTGSDITDITSSGGGGGGGSGATTGVVGGSGGGGTQSGAGGAGNEGGNGGDPDIPEGFAGGGSSGDSPFLGSGGGGGASEVGEDGTGSGGGDGGDGLANTITGSSVTYGGGGGGGCHNSIPAIGIGGAGGGGNGGSGGTGGNIAATAGTDALGGGGGGAPRSPGPPDIAGQAGGDGVVIVRISTSDYDMISSVTGTYTATATGTDTYIKWTTSGTLVT